MKQDRIQTFYPNLTIIGLSLVGVVIGFYGLYFFMENVYTLYNANASGFFETLIFSLFPIGLLAYLTYISIVLFLRLYIIDVNPDETVTIRHLTFLGTTTVQLNELYFRQKQRTSAFNDIQTSFSAYDNGRTMDLNWLKGRLYLQTKKGKNITVIRFGYDAFESIKKELKTDRMNYL